MTGSDTTCCHISWRSTARFIVVAIGLGACAIALDTPITELATRQGPLVRFVFSLLGAAALGLLTHLVWIAIHTTIDQRLAQIGPLDLRGEAMLQEVEVGRLLREPHKGKPSRIDPRVKVFRSKFETTPGKQFELRAQAIKRLGAALKAAGIGFADGRQTVYIQRADDSVQMVGAAVV